MGQEMKTDQGMTSVSSEERRIASRLGTPSARLLILAVAHLPFLFLYYRQLWQQEHYGFFPFALGVFFVLTRQRMVGHKARGLGWFSKTLIACDIVLLLGGIVLNSPWLVTLGAICLTIAWLWTILERDYECSLTYLALLPLLTLRLPLNRDVEIIQWLQPATTRLASDVLYFLSVLHVREGNVLTFEEKRFMVEEACSGVQSLFFVLFLAALIAVGNRRRLSITCLLLGFGIGVAGLMNVLRISTVAVAWDFWEWDLSGGWQHDALGYVALVIAAALMFSADALLEFLTAPVPSDEFSVSASAKSVFWNRRFTVPPRNISESLSPQTGSAAAE